VIYCKDCTSGVVLQNFCGEPYFVGDEGWGWSLWAHNTCEEIKQYRIANNLPEYSQGNEGTGTVAEVTVNGTAYYGRSENLGCLSIAQQEYWFNRMKSEGYLTGRATLASAAFLRHAEAHALVNAYNANEGLPTSIQMYSDRPTCTYACRKDLQELLKVMGVTSISINWNNIQRPPLTWTAATGWL
jgi:hypothetical protein